MCGTWLGIDKRTFIKQMKEREGLGDEESENGAPENERRKVCIIFLLLFLGLLKNSEPFEGPISLTGGTGRKGWKQPRSPEKAVCRAGWAAAPAS